MYYIILYLILILSFLRPLCYAEELNKETLIHGINQARLTIQSGEVNAKIAVEYSAEKTEQEISAWMKTEKEQALKNFNLNVNIKQYERDYLIPRLNFEARSFRQRKEIAYTNTVFKVLEQDTATREKLYQYKLTMVDSPGYSPDQMYDNFRPSDTFFLLTYDMKKQVKEDIGDIIHSVPDVSFFNSDNHYGYLHYSLAGRSHFHVPPDAKLIGKETIDDVECYILDFTAPDTRKVQIWVDPVKDFCVHKIEYRHPITDQVFTRILNKQFKRFEDVWFPQITVDVAYKKDGTLISRSTIEIIYLELNVDFPEDFFQINKVYYGLPDMGLLQDHETSTPFSPIGTDPILLLCGPQSLSRVCELLNVNTNLNELKKLSGFVPDRGTTMLGLKKAANYKGLAPAGVRASMELLKREKVPLPAIAYVNADHFLVFESINRTGVKVTDPAKKHEPHITWDELSDIWHGELLIFDKKKAHHAEQKETPLAFSDEPVYNFGRILSGSEIKHTFIIKNIGKKPLEILSVTETCVCTASVHSQNEIPPGETGSISAALIVPTGNKQIHEQLHVLTNDPVQNTLTLTLKGEAFTPLNTFPKMINFGNQLPLQKPLMKQISLHTQEGTQIQAVRTDSKYIKANLKMIDNILRVDVKFLSNLPAGKFHHNVLVDYSYKGKRATHSISTFGEVIGELRVVPNRLFLGSIKNPKSFSKTITISSRNTQPFQVMTVKSKTKKLTFTLKENKKKTQYKVTAAISPDAKPGEVTGEIVIHTSSSVQPTVRVQFFGIIVGSN